MPKSSSRNLKVFEFHKKRLPFYQVAEKWKTKLPVRKTQKLMLRTNFSKLIFSLFIKTLVSL